MQLDNTRIAVRERTLPEILDLALHVMREYFQPWLITTLWVVVPLALLNYALIGWMASPDYVSYVDGEWRVEFPPPFAEPRIDEPFEKILERLVRETQYSMEAEGHLLCRCRCRR